MLILLLLLLLGITHTLSPKSALFDSIQNAGLTSLASALATAFQSSEGQNLSASLPLTMIIYHGKVSSHHWGQLLQPVYM
jgi:hypothetical protein